MHRTNFINVPTFLVQKIRRRKPCGFVICLWNRITNSVSKNSYGKGVDSREWKIRRKEERSQLMNVHETSVRIINHDLRLITDTKIMMKE